MRFELKAYAIQEYGKRTDANGNPHQEDSIFPLYGRVGAGDRLFILCDGMGGHDAGEVASSTVCQAMSETILSNGNSPEGSFSGEDFNRALSAAYDALDSKDTGSSRAMGTTMTFLKLHDRGAYIAHIGDSRVYHIRPGIDAAHTEILHETVDHSWVARMVKAGEMTREEAHRSSQKNQITRAMQPSRCGQRCSADLYETADIRAGDYFYLCSDGMLEQYDMDSGESLKHIFSAKGGTDENRVNTLRTATAGNSDNHTAIIVHITAVKEVQQVPSHELPTPAGSMPPEMQQAESTLRPAKMPPTNQSGRYFITAYAGIIVVLFVLIGAYFICNIRTDETPAQPTTSENKILQGDTFGNPGQTTKADKRQNEAAADNGEDTKAGDETDTTPEETAHAGNGKDANAATPGGTPTTNETPAAQTGNAASPEANPNADSAAATTNAPQVPPATTNGANTSADTPTETTTDSPTTNSPDTTATSPAQPPSQG